MLRIGHKGADAIAPGNTLESFAAAVDAGVDVIELDVLRPREDFADADDWRRAPAGPDARPGGPLVIAHDWGDAARREPLEPREASTPSPPAARRVAIDLDLKVAGREDEVAAALRERGLPGAGDGLDHGVGSLPYLRDHEPALAAGWTLPKVSRDWNRSAGRGRSCSGLGGAAGAAARAGRRQRGPQLGAWAIWVYHPLITPRLVAAAHGAGRRVIAWTVDDRPRVDELAALGVDGICTNDPRLLAGLDRGRAACPWSAPRTPGRPA